MRLEPFEDVSSFNSEADKPYQLPLEDVFPARWIYIGREKLEQRFVYGHKQFSDVCIDDIVQIRVPLPGYVR